MSNRRNLFLHRVVSLCLAAALLLPVMPPMVAEAASLADFGDGRDGALVIRAGDTVTLPVLVPYQSVVEKNYTSVLIEAGGVLTTSAPNAGLVLRVQGACTINGTIDQSAKAPKTNPSNNYPYPPELQCGAGGNGGKNENYAKGGKGMASRHYGGGYGGGGAGAGEAQGGAGGDADNITINVATIFVGGAGGYGTGSNNSGQAGSYGGGGGGCSYDDSDDGILRGGAGASGGGNVGNPAPAAGRYFPGGGAGNVGGGVILIYAAGDLLINGNLLCKGGTGGNGLHGKFSNTSNSGGGGGGGGGAIFISYADTTPELYGQFNVDGGTGGLGGRTDKYFAENGFNGQLGTVTIKKAPDSSPPVISKVTTSTAWGQTNTATITATDDMTGVVSYAVTSSAATPGNGSWQSGGSFTLSANGTYYAFARDGLGNTSAGYEFTANLVDTAVPVISSVAVTPAGWTGGSTKTITVTASDSQSGVADYAITTTTTAPTDGWQTKNTFSKAAGTYYLWARDKVGRVSGYAQSAVEQIDITPPTVSSVTVPTIWDKDNMVTISAADTGSGIKSYAVTRSNTAPVDGWQKENSFLLTANGTYYAWARDNVENVSPSRPFTVNRVDDVRPVITGVQLPESWAQANVAVIDAMDAETSVSIYAVSSTPDVPMDGWQTSRSITVAANGAYYAWCKDKVGNISAPFPFTVDRVDTEIPVVTGAEVRPDGWVGTTVKTIEAAAADSQSGVAGYAITENAIPPVDGWQSPNTFSKPGGGYYLWARDKAGRVSAGYPVTVDGIDTVGPVISTVGISPGWSTASVAKIQASDVDSGLKDYAVSRYQYAPGAGWQASPSFTLSANGIYYAFARDTVGNVSEPAQFEVTAVDTAKPVVSKVNIAPGWSSCSEIGLEASDVGGGVKDYAVTADGAIPNKGWQTSPQFTLTANGSYYAWARDAVGNISAGRFFTVSRVDRILPTIGSVGYSADYATIMVKGKDGESGVKRIYLDSVPFDGGTVSLDLPEGARYIKIQVEDNAGNVSEEVTQRIPGWFDVLDTLTIEPVEFGAGNKTAVITAVETGEAGIKGVYVNGKLQPGNPVTYFLTAGLEYLELQAENKAGDRSELYTVRIPGWSTETNTISIVDVRFAEDSSSAQITAMETGGKGIRGIRVNGELLPGSPVTYQIPAGTRHLDMQAEDRDGDRSAVLIRRVPGWSEVVTTLTVTDVTFTDYNTTAQITGTATGGDSVAGMIVNGESFEGNPVIYKVPKGADTLHIQAYNAAGDKSPMLNKPVPLDASKSTLKLYIEGPGWTKERKAKVKLTAEDKSRITKVMVRTSEESEWADVTEQRYIYITANTTVYASVENDKGEVKEEHQDIECFDRTAPKVTATQDGKTVNIQATDNLSGVRAILVNGKEYQEGDFEDGKLAYKIPEGTSLITVKAEDAAGNLSRSVELPLQTTVQALPVIVKPAPPSSAPETAPQENAIPEPPPAPENSPEPEKLPLPTPGAEEISPPAEPSPVSPAAKAVAVGGSVGTTAIGGIWYWLRKAKINRPMEELELMGKKLIYDESEFGGSEDPLDKKEQGE